MKTLTLKKTEYIIKGVADISAWGGGRGCIKMDSFKLEKISNKILLDNINDGCFGVQSINGAICDIYENYEGTLQYLKTKKVGSITEYTEEYYNQI